MKQFRYIVMACIMAIAMVFGAGAQARDVVTVFAASSLKNGLDAVIGHYDGAVVVSYGGSAILARQVALGAPADVVILANKTWMDWLVEQQAVDPTRRVDLLGNRLVVIGAAGAAQLDIRNLVVRLEGGRLAIGQTTGVPAGIYGRAWLENAGIWSKVAPHLAEVENVRVALALVARQETPLGLVYASDALAEPRVSVVYEVPTNSHPPIVYPVAKIGLKGRRFLDFLQSDLARQLFVAHGFRPIGGAN